MLNAFMLSGFNLFHIYALKHKIVQHSFIFIKGAVVFDVVFLLYSVFSILYGITLFYLLYLKNSKRLISDLPIYPLSNNIHLDYTIGFICWYLLISVLSSLGLINFLPHMELIDFLSLHTEKSGYSLGTLSVAGLLIIAHCCFLKLTEEKKIDILFVSTSALLAVLLVLLA